MGVEEPLRRLRLAGREDSRSSSAVIIVVSSSFSWPLMKDVRDSNFRFMAEIRYDIA